MKVLIAEDDVTSCTMLAIMLGKHGHDVVQTVNGLEAWEVLRQPDAPRLAVLDWMMPEMDGTEVLRLIRSWRTDRPTYVIMVTAKGAKADIVAGLEAGANDYLTKPFDAGELCARIEVGRRMIELQDALAAKVDELSQALEDVKTLRGFLPICANCKKIRDDQGYWNQVEVYLRDHSEARFSHGLCPGCAELLIDELMAEDKAGRQSVTD